MLPSIPQKLAHAGGCSKGPPVLLSNLEALHPDRRGNDRPLRVAVDLGTTTMRFTCAIFPPVPSSVDIRRNPQAIFGDDVISRISAVRTIPPSCRAFKSWPSAP
jgi:uncharacterized 2Fe-2S/4Fe-4S cluster protein (DUF4445 family)